MKKNTVTSIFLFGLFLFSYQSCNLNAKQQKTNLNGTVFGSTFDIQYYGNADYSQEIETLFKSIDQSLSTYRPDSEISRWNAGDDSMRVSKYFLDIALDAKKVFVLSDGYYDPTVKTLVEGWGFGNSKPNASLTKQQVDSLLQYVGYQKVIIDTVNHKIYKEQPGIQLDFNSIAPGYTADQVSEFLISKEVDDFLVDIGGEVRCNGKNLKANKPWVIGIEDPSRSVDNRSYVETVELNDESLATSGNYRKVKTDNLGNKIVHTINPKTGMPMVSNLLSSTIITALCSDADAFATATMAMGYPKAVDFIKENKLTSYLIIQDSKNNITLKKIL